METSKRKGKAVKFAMSTSSEKTGFGWTNGVILDLLDKYGDKMKSSSKFVSVVLVPIFVFLWHFEWNVVF
ncbi:hypothetical protein ANCDUO_02585 [Ancylostoma duodenale]|uniref:Alpha,alpha-trehalase n=1 Tax=Ancylostoma duodenale TaxID=51022 RepID=A0A0C2HC55_9BILA|nr:hypothetical protein ANCDUO_02585 [Ancylostoma duodenale]